jgi:hypothetical protein
LAKSGNFLGPTTISAIIAIIISSGSPMPNIDNYPHTQ